MAFISPFPLTRGLYRIAFYSSAPTRRIERRHFQTWRVKATAQQGERGFELLKSDLRRLSKLARGDWGTLLDRSFSLQRYDHKAIQVYYDARPFSPILRLSAVGIPFLSWLFQVRMLDPWLGLSTKTEVTQRRAAQLRALLTWAGPTYLKIGQAVGNRPDLVGVVYSTELQKLVDDVGVFNSDTALRIVREELQIGDIAEVFEQFEPNAVASASLGQVHRARLRTGEEVAVKVQRPTVERDAALDVYVLRRVAEFLKRRFKLRSDLVGIVDEFATRLWEELDYINEADNCENFAELYASDNDAIYVPSIYRDHTSKRVLTMEWIDGEKAPWYPPEEARRLIRVGVQCSLQQLLDKGFVHADPHSGNLLRTKGGKLCYLDFGMCVQVDQQVRYDLIAAIVRLINRDFENLATDFVKLGFLPVDADTGPFAPLLVKAFGDASTGDNLSDLSFSRLADNLSGLAFATPIRIPVFFTLIIRSLTILEGFALQSDSTFKIIDEAYPYVVKRILTDDSPAFRRALEDILVDRETARIRWQRLSALLKTRSSSVPDGNMRTSDDANDSSQLSGVTDKALMRLLDYALSERGTFLRNALFLELTDTVDAVQLAAASRVSAVTRGLVPPPEEKVDMERVERAVNLARAFQARAPELLSSLRAGGSRGAMDNSSRLELLQVQFSEASRVVAATLVERNTRRLLRRFISTVFGRSPRPPQK